MNSVCLVGRLTKDIEVRRTISGKQVTTFDLAVKDKDTTDFIPIVVWENACEYLSKYAYKGIRLEVVGQLKMRKYESNGKTNITYEVIAKNVSVLSDKKVEEDKPIKEPEIEYAIEDEEMPF